MILAIVKKIVNELMALHLNNRLSITTFMSMFIEFSYYIEVMDYMTVVKVCQFKD